MQSITGLQKNIIKAKKAWDTLSLHDALTLFDETNNKKMKIQSKIIQILIY